MQRHSARLRCLAVLLSGLPSLLLALQLSAQPVAHPGQAAAVGVPTPGAQGMAAPLPQAFTLLSNEEAIQLRLSDQEWMLPTDHLGPVRGPLIVFQQPEARNTGATPTLTTTSPSNLLVVFEPNHAPVDMASLQVWAKKGIFKKSLLDRLKPFIQGTSIQAHNLQLPTGRFLIEVDIADQKGERTFKQYYLDVRQQ